MATSTKKTSKASATRKAGTSAIKKVRSTKKAAEESGGRVFIAELAGLSKASKDKYIAEHESNRKKHSAAKKAYKKASPKPRKLSRKK